MTITFICVFCDERVTGLVDGDFCEECYDGATVRKTESKV